MESSTLLPPSLLEPFLALRPEAQYTHSILISTTHLKHKPCKPKHKLGSFISVGSSSCSSSSSKDRHSKVATAKGLRDRRVRLSPACALQLFDIQDKLGLLQPSQAVDWLLQKAKPAIAKLPVDIEGEKKIKLDVEGSPTSPLQALISLPRNVEEDIITYNYFPRCNGQLSLSLESPATPAACTHHDLPSPIQTTRKESRAKARERARHRSSASTRSISCDEQELALSPSHFSLVL